MLLRSISVILFVLFVGVGLGYVQQSWDGEVYVTSTQMGFIRDVATVQKTSETYKLNQNYGDITSPMRMLRAMKIVNRGEVIEISVGHFIYKEKFGSKQFACQKYDRVVLSFEADGFAQSGERPKLDIEVDCEVSEDANYVRTIAVPVAKILSETVADGDFEFKEPNPVSIRIANVADEWPMYWTLMAIHLVDTRTQGPDLAIGFDEIRQNFKNPIQMLWVK